jgi:hypothetical protein
MGDLPSPDRLEHVIIVTAGRAAGVDCHGAPIRLYQNYRASWTKHPVDFFQDNQRVTYMLEQSVGPDRITAAIR